MSIQAASATGSDLFSGNKVTLLAGTIMPGEYYLVQMASAGSPGAPLPAPDTTGTVNFATGGGKVILVDDVAGLPCNAGTLGSPLPTPTGTATPTSLPRPRPQPPSPAARATWPRSWTWLATERRTSPKGVTRRRHTTIPAPTSALRVAAPIPTTTGPTSPRPPQRLATRAAAPISACRPRLRRTPPHSPQRPRTL
jgi:hypothetical protein